MMTKTEVKREIRSLEDSIANDVERMKAYAENTKLYTSYEKHIATLAAMLAAYRKVLQD
jgi:hypothetical protein